MKTGPLNHLHTLNANPLELQLELMISKHRKE